MSLKLPFYDLTDCKSLNDCGREFYNTAETKANHRPPSDLKLYTYLQKVFGG